MTLGCDQCLGRASRSARREAASPSCSRHSRAAWASASSWRASSRIAAGSIGALVRSLPCPGVCPLPNACRGTSAASIHWQQHPAHHIASPWPATAVVYFVDERTARTDFRHALQRLAAVTSEEAAAKHQALRAVRDAFVVRPSRSGGSATGAAARPTAPDYVLGEACEAARRTKANGGEPAPIPVAGGDHQGCLLGGQGQ